MSAREKALEFARNNIPKPKAKPPKQEDSRGEKEKKAANSDIEPIMK